MFSDSQGVNNVIFLYFSKLNKTRLKPPPSEVAKLHLDGIFVWLSPCSWAGSGLRDFHSPGKTELSTTAVLRGCHHSAHQSIQKWLALICCPRARLSRGTHSWLSGPRGKVLALGAQAFTPPPPLSKALTAPGLYVHGREVSAPQNLCLGGIQPPPSRRGINPPEFTCR